MEKIKLQIIGISYSQSQAGAYALILGEVEGKRRLPIIIGGFEAQSIAIELEKMKPSRPLTHDLFKTFAESFEINIKEVVIYKFAEGIFYAMLVCEQDTKTFEIDSRTSDAIAIAVRFDAPIYTYENILVSTGIMLEDDSDNKTEITDDSEETKGEFIDYTLEELDKLLLESLDEEAYERASQIRDEINKRKKSK